MSQIISRDFKFDIVEVTWHDAFHGTSPLDVAELIGQPRLEVKSVGYLLCEDENYIALGFSLYESWSSVKHWQMIPKKIIKSMVTINKTPQKTHENTHKHL